MEEFQTVRAWISKEHWSKDLVFVLGTEKGLSLLYLRELEGLKVVEAKIGKEKGVVEMEESKSGNLILCSVLHR